MKFLGTFEELQSLVTELGFSGDWTELAGDICHFITPEGAILNWWKRTKTLQCQGPPAIKEEFERRVSEGMTSWHAERKSATTKNSKKAPTLASTKSKRVFVVHGHDHTAREQLELVLHRLGLDPFVLANTGGGGLSLAEALEKEIGPRPGQCRFGIVLLTPDDMGFSKRDGVDKAEPRARQNVVLEMGMMLAAIGRPNVAILKKGHLEIPSDIQGIIYIGFNDHVREAVPKLVDRLNCAGFELDAAAVSRATA